MTRHALRFRRSTSALTTIAVAAVLFAPVTPAQAAATQTQVIGDGGIFTVPAGVSQVVVELTGGDGGTATSASGVSAIAQGGRGGLVSGTLAVTPGDELSFAVATAGSGVELTSPGAMLSGGTGHRFGGEGWASGGGSTSVRLNGTVVAGAPGGGGGAAIWTNLTSPLFVTGGGDGGASADDIVDGATLILAGGAAGGNTVGFTEDGQSANTASSAALVQAFGAGGAGWPDGGAGSNTFGSSDPIEIYLTGGGGGLPFVGPELTSSTVGIKAIGAPRDGSATVTYTVVAELAATGASDAGLLGLVAVILTLVGGALTVVTRRRTVEARRA